MGPQARHGHKRFSLSLVTYLGRADICPQLTLTGVHGPEVCPLKRNGILSKTVNKIWAIRSWRDGSAEIVAFAENHNLVPSTHLETYNHF